MIIIWNESHFIKQITICVLEKKTRQDFVGNAKQTIQNVAVRLQLLKKEV